MGASLGQIFRLIRLLRLFKLYKEYETRRRIIQALQQAGAPPIQGKVLTLIELEIMQDTNKETRVGQRLEGEPAPIVFVCASRGLTLMYAGTEGVPGR